MIKHFIIYSSLATLILSSYLPMSQKKHNFGSNICRYYDYEDQINYVRPCDTDQYCQDTETNSFGAISINSLYTCQKYIEIPENPSDPLKDRNEACEDSNECGYNLACLGSGTTKKCDKTCNTGEILYKITDNYYCRSVDNKCMYTQDSSIQRNYPLRTCKVCGKINSIKKNDGNNKEYYVVDSVDENERYSQPDGTYVIDSEACQSKTALYFYLDGKIKNEIDTAHSSQNKLYYKCVTIKAIDYKNKRFNYTEGTDKVFIYEVSKLPNDATTEKNVLNNRCNKNYMTKIELWNNNKEEYIKKLACPDENNFDDNFKRKLYYLEYPEQYLLYKDQTEVIEYLIQKEYPGIVPIKTTAGYLSSKYIILSLILLFL